MQKAKCSKVDYSSKQVALEDIKLIYVQRKFHSKKYSKAKKSGMKLDPYLCHRCGKWHITTNVNYKKVRRRN